MTDFNWRDYVFVSDKFGADKPLIEQAISSIAATGEDGEDLIRTMYKTSGKKVEITIGHILFRSSANALMQQGVINLDLEQIKKIAVDTPEGEKHLSLTGVMVHEMFHVADFKVSPKFFNDQMAKQALVSTTLTDEQRKSVTNAVRVLYQHELQQIQKATPDLNTEDAREMIYKKFRENPGFLSELAQSAGVPAGSFTYPMLTDKDFFQKQMKAMKAITDNPEPAHEQSATYFTDVFMAKHFPSEPMRVTYKNAHHTEAAPLTLPALGCGSYKPNIYQAEEASLGELGVLRQPTITPTARAECAITPPR